MLRIVILSLVVILNACSGESSVKESPKTVKKKATDAPKVKVVDDYKPKPVDPKDIVPPTEAIKGLDQQVEGYHLGKNLTPQQQAENKKLKQEIIRGTFDIRELCRLSLGKHWKTLSEDQKVEFVEMMTQLLETKAIFSKEQLRGSNKLYNITYSKETYDDTQKQKATVKTKMKVPKEKMILDITYKMLLTPYGWKIFDVIVDDASLLSNYKFQFDRIIQKKGFNELMLRMRKKLAKIGQPKKPKTK